MGGSAGGASVGGGGAAWLTMISLNSVAICVIFPREAEGTRPCLVGGRSPNSSSLFWVISGVKFVGAVLTVALLRPDTTTLGAVVPAGVDGSDLDGTAEAAFGVSRFGAGAGFWVPSPASSSSKHSKSVALLILVCNGVFGNVGGVVLPAALLARLSATK